jgi:citrate synthase
MADRGAGVEVPRRPVADALRQCQPRQDPGETRSRRPAPQSLQWQRRCPLGRAAARPPPGRDGGDAGDRLGRSGPAVGDFHRREWAALVSRSGCGAAAESATLEEVAALLWQTSAMRAHADPAVAKSAHTGTPIGRLLSAVSERAAIDPPSRGRSPAVLKSEAELLFGRLLDASLGTVTARSDLPMHTRLAKAWRKPKAQDILRRTLVLLADHELNASTFAVRVAASTGASLSACLLAGLATLTGPLHGGAARALSSSLDAARQTSPSEAVRDWLGRGEPLPAFGHPLYPEGDPRAIAIMRHVKLSGMFLAVRKAAEDVTGEPPNVDFALAALADAYALPRQAPFVIFALSRSVGWIAHALEQIAAGQLIRAPAMSGRRWPRSTHEATA